MVIVLHRCHAAGSWLVGIWAPREKGKCPVTIDSLAQIHNLAAKCRDTNIPEGGLFGQQSGLEVAQIEQFRSFAGQWPYRAAIWAAKLVSDGQTIQVPKFPPLFIRRWQKGKSAAEQTDLITHEELAEVCQATTGATVRQTFDRHYSQAWEEYFTPNPTGQRDELPNPKTARALQQIRQILILEALFLASFEHESTTSTMLQVLSPAAAALPSCSGLNTAGTSPNPDITPGTWKRLEDGIKQPGFVGKTGQNSTLGSDDSPQLRERARRRIKCSSSSSSDTGEQGKGSLANDESSSVTTDRTRLVPQKGSDNGPAEASEEASSEERYVGKGKNKEPTHEPGRCALC